MNEIKLKTIAMSATLIPSMILLISLVIFFSAYKCDQSSVEITSPGTSDPNRDTFRSTTCSSRSRVDILNGKPEW